MPLITVRVALKYIGLNTHALAQMLDEQLKGLGFEQLNENYFDTLNIKAESAEMVNAIRKEAEAAQMNFRYFGENQIGISLHQNMDVEEVKEIVEVFAKVAGKKADTSKLEIAEETNISWPEALIRKSEYLTA